MRVIRYRGRHLRARPVRRGPVVVGTAATVWVAGSSARAGMHEVAPGETLSAIAARYGTSVSKLASANGLADPDVIVAGQRLRVPGGMSSTATHTIRSGETLSAIAARFGTSVGALARANRIQNPSLIVAGATLKVPSSGATAPIQEEPDLEEPDPEPISTSSIEDSLERHAQAHGVDVALVKAVAWQESGWRQDVRSSAGAIGVMQVMPGTARYVNEVLGDHQLDVRIADDNVHLGVMYLRHMLEVTSSVRRGLAAYFAGPAAVGRKLDGAQRHYADNVQALRRRFA